MAFKDLQSFLQELERQGQLWRISAEVDPHLEITEIADRVSKMPAAGATAPPDTDPVHGCYGGRALLFEQVRGSDLPVVINVFGSYRRICMALGCENLEGLAERVQHLVRPEIPTGLLEKIKKLPELLKLTAIVPKTVQSGMCQEVVESDKPDLLTLPIIQCWPEDGGRYITLGFTLTEDPDSDQKNLGLYRIQILGPQKAAMHWHVHHDGARHWRKYAAAGQRMPVAVIFGAEPAVTYAASAPLPPDLSELLFAGFIHGTGIEMTPCKTVPLEVPANAEIVIEGWVSPDEKVLEGPFGDHTGFYSLPDEYPLFEVTAITRRREAVYPTTIVGKPPMEDYYLGKATERIFLPLVRVLVPDIIDYHMPMFGAFHNCVFIKIRKEYPYHARKVMHAIWGAGQMMLTKFIIVVDEHVNVHDEQEVLFQMCANVDPRRDICMADGPMDVLDHAAPYCGTGSKMGIDATRKIAGEGTVRAWPGEIEMSDEIKKLVTRRWDEYGIKG